MAALQQRAAQDRERGLSVKAQRALWEKALEVGRPSAPTSHITSCATHTLSCLIPAPFACPQCEKPPYPRAPLIILPPFTARRCASSSRRASPQACGFRRPGTPRSPPSAQKTSPRRSQPRQRPPGKRSRREPPARRLSRAPRQALLIHFNRRSWLRFCVCDLSPLPSLPHVRPHHPSGAVRAPLRDRRHQSGGGGDGLR